ncbi:hypothetical protein FRC03_012012 [Tulasnella sp. 419]|nr:hypothetical protein FRC03_012012 [Tulasnella sp. 419]
MSFSLKYLTTTFRLWLSAIILSFLIKPIAAKLTQATCSVVCSTENCKGFLPSVPLRTGPQILTTAVVTGLLAAWQSSGSGQGGLTAGLTRTLLQAFVPEIALFRLHRLGYAMDPKFEEWTLPERAVARCHEFQPTKAQIVAVHLGLMAVRGEAADAEPRQASETGHGHKREASDVLSQVSNSTGWRDVKFHHDLQPGYRLVTLQEAIYLPQLFHALPHGRRTILGTPVPQASMVLLLFQAIYFVVFVIARAASNHYTAAIEWFFLPTSFTFIALGVSDILWEPAWKDIAHINLDLGKPLPHYPWTRTNKTRIFLAAVTSFVIPIGPITTLVAWGTEYKDRPQPTSIALLVGGALWAMGFLFLFALALAGRYKPFGASDPSVSDLRSEIYGLGFGTALVIMRVVVLAFAIYELSVIPAAAFRQLAWTQYFPHV